MICDNDDTSEYETLRTDDSTLDIATDGHIVWSKTDTTMPWTHPVLFGGVQDLELNIQSLAAVLFVTKRCNLDTAVQTICRELARNIESAEHVAYITDSLQKRLQ
ncbi:hypothetical protein DJ031_00155 [bacterium endosymbiont of Escarpia laminata]|nr:MAG: hypothetical protein DJ031_00155 [bacterium endosymbiont of Escarpia laminata]